MEICGSSRSISCLTSARSIRLGHSSMHGRSDERMASRRMRTRRVSRTDRRQTVTRTPPRRFQRRHCDRQLPGEVSSAAADQADRAQTSARTSSLVVSSRPSNSAMCTSRRYSHRPRRRISSIARSFVRWQSTPLRGEAQPRPQHTLASHIRPHCSISTCRFRPSSSSCARPRQRRLDRAP